MTFLRRLSGEWLVCSRSSRIFGKRTGRIKDDDGHSYRGVHIVRCSKSGAGMLEMNQLIFPASFIGKRIRIRVEVLQ